jgi:hypothetical protein
MNPDELKARLQKAQIALVNALSKLDNAISAEAGGDIFIQLVMFYAARNILTDSAMIASRAGIVEEEQLEQLLRLAHRWACQVSTAAIFLSVTKKEGDSYDNTI